MMIGIACRTGRTTNDCREMSNGGVIRLLDDETMDTTMDVDVDELWTMTVAKRPSIRPAIGFDRTAPSVNALPVILPNEAMIQRRREWIDYLRPVEKRNSSHPTKQTKT